MSIPERYGHAYIPATEEQLKANGGKHATEEQVEANGGKYPTIKTGSNTDSSINTGQANPIENSKPKE